MSVSSATVRTPLASPSPTITSASSRARSTSGRNAPDPTLTSSTSASVPSAIFLRHDRAGDERDRLDRRRHVAQGVELAVGRRQARARRAAMIAPTDRSCATASALVSIARQPGDRLHLVERPAGVAEAAPAELGHGRAAVRDERDERQRDLVADAAGGVLVDGRPADRRQVEPLAGVDHRLGPLGQLGRLHPLEQDRHAQRRRLLVGDRARRVALDEEADLLARQAAAVTLRAEHVEDVGRHAAVAYRPARPASQAWGSHSRIGRSFTSSSGPPCSQSSCRHRPHGARSRPSGEHTATATSRPPPVACSAETRPHSAHSVSPYDPFSTLQPTTIRPSSTSAGGADRGSPSTGA